MEMTNTGGAMTVPIVKVSKLKAAPADSVVEQALRGLTVGVMVGLILFFVFRPREPYPRWVLVPYEQPWMLLIVALVLILVFQWDQRVSLLMLLFVLGVGLDVHIYGKNYSHKDKDSQDSPESIYGEKEPTGKKAGSYIDPLADSNPEASTSPSAYVSGFADANADFYPAGEPLATVPLMAADGLTLPTPHYPLYQNPSLPFQSGSPSPFF
jgi:hypothetical protein